MYTFSVSTSNSKEAFCMVYHTFLGKFQPTFSISGGGGWFKKTLRVFDYRTRWGPAVAVVAAALVAVAWHMPSAPPPVRCGAASSLLLALQAAAVMTMYSASFGAGTDHSGTATVQISEVSASGHADWVELRNSNPATAAVSETVKFCCTPSPL